MTFSSGLSDFTNRLLNLSQSSPGSYGVLGTNSSQSTSLVTPTQGANANIVARPDAKVPAASVALWSQVASPATFRI
jgi:hypothetical protein